MEQFISPYTGKVFTNAKIFRQHVKDWPAICEGNGLNLDGTPKAQQVKVEPPKEKVAEPEVVEVECQLPEDMPHRTTLDKAGVKSLEDLPTDLKGLTKLNNIGKQKANEILEWLVING